MLRKFGRLLIMVAVLRELTVPDEEMTAQASQAAGALAKYLRTHPTPTGRVTLCIEDARDTTATVPAQAFRLFIELLDQLAQGNAVTIAPVTAELTTQQAAELVGVSRPYFIKLLEQGELAYRKVGNRRRIRLVDVLDYQRRDEQKRQRTLKALTREAEDLGLYE